MNVTTLKSSELQDMVEIGHAFTKSVDYPGGFDIESFQELWSPVIARGLGEIFVVRADNGRLTGALGASFSVDPFNGWLTASEVFWFVHPEFRGSSIAVRLFDAFEKAAEVRGCKRFVMACLDGEFYEPLSKFFAKRGYRPFERTMTKEM